jgi:DNA-binding protein HU-beta
MTKTDLVNRLAEKLEITKKQSGEIIDALFSVDPEGLGIIAETLKTGEKIQLIGFGNFEVKERVARKGRNPQTGEEIDIAASKSVGFSVGKKLKEAVQ